MTLPTYAEFVNGHYALTESKHIEIDGRRFTYQLGEAVLDNSCCGELSCSYALVQGEVLTDQATALELDAVTKDTIAQVLLNTESISVVNFAIKA